MKAELTLIQALPYTEWARHRSPEGGIARVELQA